MRYRDQPATTLYAGIGERIMLARRRAGLSQRAFGERIGLSHAAVSDVERAKSRPDLDNLAVIADALGVPLGEILAIGDGRRAPRAATGGDEG